MEENTVVITLIVCALLTAVTRLLYSKAGPSHKEVGAADFLRFIYLRH